MRVTLAVCCSAFAIYAVTAVATGYTQERAATAVHNVDWRTYLGGASRTHYSSLAQINRSNVAELRVAWTHDTGERGEYQSNNLVVNGILYTATPERRVVALDASTGRELWNWNPMSERRGPIAGRQRGLAYWQDSTGDNARILTSAGTYLYALDARSGTVIRSFGVNGSLHLGTGAPSNSASAVPTISLNTPGIVYRDMYIVSGVAQAPGTVRAYDVRSGALRWVFNTLPKNGEFGFETWPPNAIANRTIGGANEWAGSALDSARGILYVPTASARPDFWGGHRHGANLFANSLLALDASTGKRIWHFQIVHHDVLDRDLSTPPVLMTVRHNGRTVDAVAQGTKHGLLFVFNRVTGEPLWPVEERSVPLSSLPGEQSSATQPFPIKPPPLMRQQYGAADVSTVTPNAKSISMELFGIYGSFGAFPPSGLKETIMFPGFEGGMNWGGGAADELGIYYVNVSEIPWLYRMVPTVRQDGSILPPGERSYLNACAACHGIGRGGDPSNGYPSLLDLPGKMTRPQVLDVLQRGAGRMPSFEATAPATREAIVDYLLGIGQPASLRQALPELPPYAFVGFRRWEIDGYPAISPPWGTLVAVDLNTGDIKWKVILGEYAELTARGIPATGTENYGGPIATAGGLVFIGATADETFRAFDKDTGRILWQAKLPFGGNATPSTYSVNGKQYVVISAGGGKSGRPAGGTIVAFTLPD